MTTQFQRIVDISLELDPNNFAMRTPAGFTKDMQFEMEVIKEHDSPGGRRPDRPRGAYAAARRQQRSRAQ